MATQPRRARTAIAQPFGAVVVVGPTGSGKTTTLYTCLQVLNTPDRQLTTIEDPVEYRAAGLDQIEVNPRAGLTFANGLRTILRSDPDVLLVGEIRDEETAQIAFRAAMTGHLVLTTLHAQTAASAIQRLTDMNIERSILATSINCIVGQRLARRVCQSCCEPSDAGSEQCSEAAARAGRLRRAQLLPGRRLLPSAASTGYRGRVPLFEVLTMTDEIALLVGAPTREIEAMAIVAGHVHAARGRRPARDAPGITTLEEIRRVAGETPSTDARRNGSPALDAPLRSRRRWPSSSSATRNAIAALLRRNGRRTSTSSAISTTSTGRTRAGSAGRRDGALEQVVLLYTEPAVPVLLAIADEPHGAMAALAAGGARRRSRRASTCT